MASTPLALPALVRAEKIQKKASLAGFDWEEPQQVFSKLEEETLELKDAIKRGDKNRVEEEVGDLLFSTTNLARHLRVNAEEALRKSNKKFLNRFRYIEEMLQQSGSTIEDSSMDEMNQLWERAKEETRDAK